MVVSIKVIPRAAGNEVVGCVDGVLRIRVTAAPVDGQANRLLVELLCKHIKSRDASARVKKSDIRIIKGEKSKNKLVEITGIDSI
ncbi:MAG: DUF167 domain-containing protein [Magnetococcales bacterium]|uniref:UPF0235 protein HWQ67_11395 n=1 Tax=Candidatus Magnetobacterium casense TaxID=1455061 RepID=A0ABS6S0S7_9BACT|nr:DUF167 domain-containing protein [Nitrospirota bacterium]MBV6342190.1 DUF167 domain-containing protein [Candidatus Magnetobacterium casensis]